MPAQREGGAAAGRIAGVTVAALLLLGAATRLTHGFEWDELQLLHGAWRIAQGDVPYRDFFEHHPPLLHVLVAPLVRGETGVSWRLLVEMRLLTAAVAVCILLALVGLLRRSAAPDAAASGAAVMLVLCPVSGKLFELRADWVALLALLGTTLLLVRRTDRGGVLTAGVLAGLATCFTQKAIPLWLGMASWLVLYPSPASSRQTSRPSRVLAFLAGVLTPLSGLILVFWSLGALGPLIDSTVTVNLAWPREVGLEATWRRSAIAALGAVALAARSVGGVIRGLLRGDADGRERSLIAFVAVSGVAAFAISPTPWEQSCLMLVVPWVGFLAVDALGRYAAAPERFGRDLPLLALATVVAAGTLPLDLGVRAVMVAIIAGAAIVVGLRAERGAQRLRRAMIVMLLPGAALFVADRMGDVSEARGGAQMRFARAVSAVAPPRAAVLTLWDHVLPFRPTPVFHWFAHDGVLRRFEAMRGTASLDREFSDAVSEGRAPVVIADGIALREHLPLLASTLGRRCRLVATGYAGSDAYRCEAHTAPPVRRAAPADAANVVLVVIDTLRADHVSCYGYRRATTTVIDALASEGVVFEQAIGQAPWTAASVGSLLTGLDPSVHGIDGGIEWSGDGSPERLPFATQRALRRFAETLAERLGSHGYVTAGFISNVYLNGVFGFARGFDVYADDHVDYSSDVMTRKRRAAETNRRVEAWLDGNVTEPFFLFVHYNDPHWPYDPPPPFGAEWTAGYGGTLTPAETAAVVESEGRPVPELRPDDAGYLEGLYDGEIAYADASLGALLAHLRTRPLLRPVLTVVTADHGEEFLDHGSTSHGYTLYDEQIHVPLVVHLPAALRPSHVAAQVRLIDVAPTILELVGIARRPGVQGRSLVPLMRGDGAARGRDAFSEAPLRGMMRSIRTAAGLKLIQDAARQRLHLYDLRRDPAEREDLLGRDAGVERDLKRRLTHHVAQNGSRGDRFRGGDSTDGVLVDDPTRRRLEALGYVAAPHR